MWWRERGKSAAANRRGLREIVNAGRVPGLLAYEDGTAIGWVSVAPHDEYGHLSRSRHYGAPEPEKGLWSIVCFIVDPAQRHRGVARALLEGAVEHALSQGARAVEAYPHVRRADYMGSAEMFASAGFKPVREAGVRTIARYRPRHSGQSTSRPAVRSATQSRRRTPATRSE
jgi:GNAT superfamily N-acetyltransferase